MEATKKEIWIFLSHSSEDFSKVRRIRNYLEERSYRPLMFYLKCLDSEEEIYDLITREIDVRSRFILCDSENARNSVWVKKEMDYISSQYPPRSFLRVDLSQSEDIIHQQLDSYVNQTNIYISCSRVQVKLFDRVRARLSKYDLRVFPDLDIISHGNYFYQRIKNQINYAADNGYCFFIFSNSQFSLWVLQEIKLAEEFGANIVLITLNQESEIKCLEDHNLSKYKRVNINNTSEEEMADTIVNRILEMIFPLGVLMTYEENFKTGRLGVKDEDESRKLDQLILSQAYESDNPYALKLIGECYEYGKYGLPVDLHQASIYYSMAIHEPGGPSDEKFLDHVKELNTKIYSSQPQQTKTYFWNIIKRLFTLLFKS